MVDGCVLAYGLNGKSVHTNGTLEPEHSHSARFAHNTGHAVRFRLAVYFTTYQNKTLAVESQRTPLNKKTEGGCTIVVTHQSSRNGKDRVKALQGGRNEKKLSDARIHGELGQVVAERGENGSALGDDNGLQCVGHEGVHNQ